MKRHEFDPVSFVFGVIFLGLAAAVALPATPVDLLFFGEIGLGWVPPVILIAIGLALLVPLFRRDEEPEEDDEDYLMQ